jgi:hypothetical protein
MTSAAELLVETARRGELHHAIILHGPSRSVLQSLAVRVARTLNCLNGTGGDDCASCQKIERRVHPDVHFIEVDGDRKMISIEQVRELVAGAGMRPYEARNKVFIIDPADGISTSGSNALLKTLEEPTRDTTFLLLTRSPDLLLPTIRSRSQSIYVGDRPLRAIGASIDDVRLEQIASFESPAARDTAVRQIDTLLGRYADNHDGAALLALAAWSGGQEAPADAMALLAIALTSESGPAAAIPRERRLAAADALLAGIRALGVNADARLVVEAALAELAVDGARR